MGKIDVTRWETQLRTLGMRGKLPEVITEAVLEAVRTHPLGASFSIADGKVPGLALDVGAGGAATWWLAFRTRAAQRRRLRIATAGAVTPKAAREIAMEALAAVGRGEDPAEARKQARAAGQTIDQYLTDVYVPKVLDHAKGGAATEARIRASWKPLLSSPLAQITRDAIEKVLADRKEAGREAGTLLRDWSSFRAMLADAVDRGHLTAVPLARRPEPIRKLRGNQRVRYLGQKDPEQLAPNEKGERQRFEETLEAFTSDEPGGGDFLRFASGLALATGMRRGEIVRLTDRLINKRERRIELTAEITKSNKARTVYLSDAALVALAMWKIRGKHGELCPGEGEREEVAERWEDRITQREWPRLCAAAKLEDFHFHDCRHDYATRLLRSGATLAQVRDALGHASTTQTEKYSHVIPSDVRAAVLALGTR